jgi:ATP-dependent Clp protease adaptor protein ClpS
MSTITKKKKSLKINEEISKNYNLIIHNDDYNTFDWVIACLIKVCGHEYEQANQCAHIIHFKGKCAVKYGEYSIINKMKDELKGAGLSATMEQV